WHVGHQPDKRSIAVAKKYGIDITAQRAQWFQPELFDRYDHILVMDDNNLRDVLALARDDWDRAKVQLFLPEGIVPDPYYDETQLETVYSKIDKRCKELLKEQRK